MTVCGIGLGQVLPLSRTPVFVDDPVQGRTQRMVPGISLWVR
jgi:hypothetical protein